MSMSEIKGLFMNKIDPSSLQRGDHVYSYRNGRFYSHHGIYVGENRVIHFTRTQESKSSNHKITSCLECGYEPKKHRGVVKSCLKCFLKGHTLFRFNYSVSSFYFVFKRSGTCTTGSCGYSQDEVVQRACEMLNSVEGFGEYDIMENNCEAFAVYCKTGKRVSSQADSLKNKAKTAYEDLKSQAFSVKNTGKTFFKLAVTHKIDRLQHDRAVHQLNCNDHEQ